MTSYDAARVAIGFILGLTLGASTVCIGFSHAFHDGHEALGDRAYEPYDYRSPYAPRLDPPLAPPIRQPVNPCDR